MLSGAIFRFHLREVKRKCPTTVLIDRRAGGRIASPAGQFACEASRGGASLWFPATCPLRINELQNAINTVVGHFPAASPGAKKNKCIT
jgi:hypothetical protein